MRGSCAAAGAMHAQRARTVDRHSLQHASILPAAPGRARRLGRPPRAATADGPASHVRIIGRRSVCMSCGRSAIRTLRRVARRHATAACFAGAMACAACGASPPDTPAPVESPAAAVAPAPAGEGLQVTGTAPTSLDGSLTVVVLEPLAGAPLEAPEEPVQMDQLGMEFLPPVLPRHRRTAGQLPQQRGRAAQRPRLQRRHPGNRLQHLDRASAAPTSTASTPRAPIASPATSIPPWEPAS